MSFNERVRERAGERHPLIAVDEGPDYLTGAVAAWIYMSISPAKSYHRGVSSYTLKHLCEDDLDCYVPQDLFKGVMALAGFKVKNLDELNWEFKIRYRHGRRVRTRSHEGFGVDRERSDPVELALFDCLASWASLNEHFDSRRRREARGIVDPYRPLVEERDRQRFRRAGRFGLVGEEGINEEVYRAIVGPECRPPPPGLRDCA